MPPKTVRKTSNVSMAATASLVATARPGASVAMPRKAPIGIRPAAALPQAKQTKENAIASRALLRGALKTLLPVRAKKKFGLTLGTFTPTNLELFMQAYDGAMAGMIGGRSISSDDTLLYADQSIAASVWAQEFDTLWASATAITELQAEVVLLESYAVWDGRAPVTLTAAEAATTINAIITSVLAAESVFAQLGITPPLWRIGGGGGATATQSGFASGDGIALGSDFASVLSAPISATLVTGSLNCCLTASMDFGVTTYGGSPLFTLELFIDGSSVLSKTYLFPVAGDSASQGSQSYSLNFRAPLTAAAHTFDLQASVTATSGSPEAVHAELLLVVTN